MPTSSNAKNYLGVCSEQRSGSTEGNLANAGQAPHGASGSAFVSNKPDHMREEEPQDDCELLEEGEILEGGEILQESETLKEGTKKRLETSDGAGATAQVTASVKPQASGLPNEPDIANEDLDGGPRTLRRENLPWSTPLSPCVFGFIHETEKPSMVGSTANDTHDWQAVLRINAVENNHPRGLTLQIRVAHVQRHAPINRNPNHYDGSSLSWNVPNLDENRELMIRSLNSCPFGEWYEKATPKVQALSIIQKVRSESINRSIIVIECLTGRSFLFNDFQRSKRWERLPAELMTQVGKARTGMDIMTFIIDTKRKGVITSLQWLEEDTFFSQ
ncbi:MAG: hypothetical protein L6R38_008464 [Xanthoria sp. 2 TBL-2021]|nr:MAG: hypothetical protein L6R38_008464 [Xanthoria sp. 2 TBL-2021]